MPARAQLCMLVRVCALMLLLLKLCMLVRVCAQAHALLALMLAVGVGFAMAENMLCDSTLGQKQYIMLHIPLCIVIKYDCICSAHYSSL
jgi:hypothetical protein